MDRVFIYWDNSNIVHEAQRLAEEHAEGPDARYRVGIDFENTLRLAHADRPVERAVAAGVLPPEMRQLWNRMEGEGIEVRLFDCGAPERVLQVRMLEDALDHSVDPGIVVLLTGDGAGYLGDSGLSQHVGADAQPGLASRDPVVGALHEPAHASMGRSQRQLRRAGRLLRGDYLHGAVAKRIRVCFTPRFGPFGPFAPMTFSP